MLPVQASNSWGRTSDRGCGYGPPPSAWPGPSAGTGRTVPPRWIVKPARSTAAAVSRPMGIRDQAGPERGETVLPAGQAPATLRRPAYSEAPALADRGPGHGCVLRRRQASHRTITPTAANTASSGWNPDPCQLGGLEAHQPRPGGHRQLPGIPVAAPLPPPGQQETTAGQPGQQHPRHPPVAERSTRQHGRVRPQQRPIRGGRQQHTPSQARSPGSPAATRPAPAHLHRAPARRRAGPPGHVRQPAQYRSYPDGDGAGDHAGAPGAGTWHRRTASQPGSAGATFRRSKCAPAMIWRSP
jgi:hypothetical protein